MRSYYAATANHTTDYPVVEGEVRADVAIVGGGFTGIATAVELAERGFKVAVLEANRIGWGASGRNGGQVTGSLSGDKAMGRQFRRTLGDAADDFIWHLRWRGHDIIRTRIERYAIDCDLKFGHLHAAYSKAHVGEIEAMYEAAVRRGMGEDVELVSAHAIPRYLETPLYHGALFNRRNMHLHSLNLLLGEAAAATELGALIYEGSMVERIAHTDPPSVVTSRGAVTADAVLLAGNAYHRLERRAMAGRLFPAGLGILATVPLGEEVAEKINPHDVAVYDSRLVLDYHRLTADRRLLFGGGTNYSGRDPKDVARELRPALERTFPRLKGVEVEMQWTGQGGIVFNRVPLVGKLSSNVYYVEGYSGHGIATSHVLAEIAAKAVAGTLEEFDVFASVEHLRVPLGPASAGLVMAAGMWFFRQLERIR